MKNYANQAPQTTSASAQVELGALQKMKLETQIEKLAELGLVLNDGISIDDFLNSFDRNELESKPFDLTLFVYGIEVEREPWGRYFCDRVWHFDTECIEEDGNYVSIVENLHRIAGRAKDLKDVSDSVDVEGGKARLEYTVNGERRVFDIRVEGDWADPEVVQFIMEDLSAPGHAFYSKDNGQASIWFHLTQEEAESINTLAGNPFHLESKPWWKFW